MMTKTKARKGLEPGLFYSVVDSEGQHRLFPMPPGMMLARFGVMYFWVGGQTQCRADNDNPLTE